MQALNGSTKDESPWGAAGRSGDVGRLEDALAKALAAQSTAAAELIEEKRARGEEAGSLSAALEAARGRVSEVQGRMASLEENNERLLREQEVASHALPPPPPPQRVNEKGCCQSLITALLAIHPTSNAEAWQNHEKRPRCFRSPRTGASCTVHT